MPPDIAQSPLRGQNQPSVWGRGRCPESGEHQLGTDLRKQPRGGNGTPAGDRGTRGRQSPCLEMLAARVPPWAPTGSPGLPAALRVRPLAPRPNIPRETGPRGRGHSPRSNHPRLLPRHRPTLPLPVSGWSPRAPVPVSVEPPRRGKFRGSELGRAGSTAAYRSHPPGFLVQ